MRLVLAGTYLMEFIILDANIYYYICLVFCMYIVLFTLFPAIGIVFVTVLCKISTPLPTGPGFEIRSTFRQDKSPRSFMQLGGIFLTTFCFQTAAQRGRILRMTKHFLDVHDLPQLGKSNEFPPRPGPTTPSPSQ